MGIASVSSNQAGASSLRSENDGAELKPSNNQVLLNRNVRDAKKGNRKRKANKNKSPKKNSKRSKGKKNKTAKRRKNKKSRSQRRGKRGRKLQRRKGKERPSNKKRKAKKSNKTKKSKKKAKKARKGKNQKRSGKRGKKSQVRSCEGGTCSTCETSLHKTLTDFGGQARNFKRQIERAMNNLNQMQKKLASKDDFNVTRDHFGSFPAGTVCNGPHVKGAPNPIPTRTADNCTAIITSCSADIARDCANPDTATMLSSRPLEETSIAGDLHQKLWNCKNAIDAYRYYLGQDDAQYTAPAGTTADDNNSTAKFCTNKDEVANKKQAFIDACTITFGSDDNEKPLFWDNRLKSLYSTCKNTFSECRKVQRYVCASSGCTTGGASNTTGGASNTTSSGNGTTLVTPVKTSLSSTAAGTTASGATAAGTTATGTTAAETTATGTTAAGTTAAGT